MVGQALMAASFRGYLIHSSSWDCGVLPAVTLGGAGVMSLTSWTQKVFIHRNVAMDNDIFLEVFS